MNFLEANSVPSLANPIASEAEASPERSFFISEPFFSLDVSLEAPFNLLENFSNFLFDTSFSNFFNLSDSINFVPVCKVSSTSPISNFPVTNLVVNSFVFWYLSCRFFKFPPPLCLL